MLTILWHDTEAAGYTDQIELRWLSENGTHIGVVHDVVGPRGGCYEAKCDITVDGTVVDFNYITYEDFNIARGMLIGLMRVRFSSVMRDYVYQVLWKEQNSRRFLPCSTTVTFTAANLSDFDKLVAESLRLTPDERRRRLIAAPKKPSRTRVVSTAFIRNPDVVAEVLFRANGTCEVCKQPAPFKRASDQSQYLEVHHKSCLAGGGDDTLENAIAVCPNCHREAHYGIPGDTNTQFQQ